MTTNILQNLNDFKREEVNIRSFSYENTKRKQYRACSFCNNIGHNVVKCDDIRLCLFKRYLIYMKDEIILDDNIEMNNNGHLNDIFNSIRKIEKMEEILYEFCTKSEENRKLIKTFACRFCSCRLRSRIQISINKIVVYLFELNYSIILNHSLNNTHFSEENPQRISCVLNGILINYYINDIISDNNNSYDSETKYSDSLSVIKIELCNSKIDNPNEIIDCSICYNDFKTLDCVNFNCNHNFCSDCTVQLVKNKHVNCPNCRTQIIQMNCYNNEIMQKIKQPYDIVI